MSNTETEDQQSAQTTAQGQPTGNRQDTSAPIESASLSAEQIEELKQKAAKADEHWERLLRSVADFDNFKKRAAREKTDSIKYANESLLEKLMPVLDNFDMALAATQGGSAGGATESLQTGISMIFKQLKTVLQEAGLEEIDATGKVFDPNFHEAVAQKETAEVPDHHVVQQVRKGYKLRDRLLRPASVIVAKQPAA